MERKPFPIWRRVQVQVGLRWDMLPAAMTWREWAWDPSGNFTLPGHRVTPANRPQGMGAHWAEHRDNGDMYAKYIWISGAIRVLGLDIGAGFFYRLRSAF